MRLCEFLRAHPDTITARWLERVQALDPAKDLPPLALLDQMPQIIERLADVVTALAEGGSGTLADLPREHALDRIAKGYSLREILREYSLLRQSILELWAEQVGDTVSVTEAKQLAFAMDEAIDETLKLAGERGAAELRTERLARGDAERDAGEQRDIATALGFAEARLRLAVEVTGMGTFEWQVGASEIAWSAEAHQIFGITPGVPITPRLVAQLALEADRPRLEAALQQAMDPGGDGAFECDSRFRRYDDGEERWVVLRGRIFFDQKRLPARMVGTMLDITDRQRESQRQRFLADATAVLSSTLDDREILDWITRLAVPTLGDWAAVDLVLADGKIERLAVTHTESHKEQVVKDVARRFPPEADQPSGSRKVIQSGQPELMAQVTDEWVARLARDDEQLKLLQQMGLESYVCVPLIAHGRVLGAFSIVSTHAGRRFDQADLELALNLAQRAALNVENARLYQDSKEAAKHREQMLAIVSHDLRNPLNAIVVAGSMLVKRLSQLPQEERARRHAEIVERSSRRMEQLIDHLLDVASIQAGRLKLTPRPEAAGSLLKEAHELEAPLASEHGIALTVEDETEQLVSADRARLLEVFENLIGNAIKFCHSGDSIVARARPGDGCVVFSVKDTGPGVPEDQREHIFEPYWSSSKPGRGTGLGLFISKGIVEAHGGTIWVQSSEGEGTTFFFTVPVATSIFEREVPRPSIH